jgi:poly-gamma-glutamate synthesis protein (capsule biosynthesis protein)
MRKAITRQGFWTDPTPILRKLIFVDDMANVYADTRDYAVDFLTTDIFLHAYHLIFDRMLQKLEMTCLAPALEKLLTRAVAEFEKARGQISPEGEKAYAVALDMFRVPLALLGKEKVGLSDRASVEAERILSAGGADVSAITGDIMVHGAQLDAAGREGARDFSPQFQRLTPLFKDALVVGNLETVFAGEEKKFTGQPPFNTPDELARDLRKAGVSVVTLANNHLLDRQEAGAARTVDVLNATGILWTGLACGDVGPPLIVNHAGLRWAFLSYTYGSNVRPSVGASPDVRLNILSRRSLLEGLAKATAEKPDIITVCLHWGTEYQTAPSPRARELAAWCLKNGADMVVGTHPHVLQPMEIARVEDRHGFVAYSLGNFIAGQRTPPRERSVVLAVDIVKKTGGRARIARVSVAPIRVLTARSGGHGFEAVYCGADDGETDGQFNKDGLSAGELAASRTAGRFVIDFLGAEPSPDKEGFYTVWDAATPDVRPTPRREQPF